MGFTPRKLLDCDLSDNAREIYALVKFVVELRVILLSVYSILRIRIISTDKISQTVATMNSFTHLLTRMFAFSLLLDQISTHNDIESHTHDEHSDHDSSSDLIKSITVWLVLTALGAVILIIILLGYHYYNKVRAESNLEKEVRKDSLKTLTMNRFNTIKSDLQLA